MNNNETYLVGYGKPPKSCQFVKGKSGNSKGRPKNSKNLDTLIEDEFSKIVTIKEGDKTLRVSKRQALIKQLTNRGIKGDAKSIALCLMLMERLESKKEIEGNIKPPDKAELELIKTVFGVQFKITESEHGDGK